MREINKNFLNLEKTFFEEEASDSGAFLFVQMLEIKQLKSFQLHKKRILMVVYLMSLPVILHGNFQQLTLLEESQSGTQAYQMQIF